MCVSNKYIQRERSVLLYREILCWKKKEKGKKEKGPINLRVGNMRGTGGRKRRGRDILLFQLKIFLKRHKPNYNPQMVSQQNTILSTCHVLQSL